MDEQEAAHFGILFAYDLIHPVQNRSIYAIIKGPSTLNVRTGGGGRLKDRLLV
ncbi:hypothetical protein JCM10914_3901 [Paenibacillus sp. JCM 10914]|nr:hypothetical protein JCM10914_3901 [Paenibacillus sp. JCM 10914]